MYLDTEKCLYMRWRHHGMDRRGIHRQQPRLYPCSEDLEYHNGWEMLQLVGILLWHSNSQHLDGRLHCYSSTSQSLWSKLDKTAKRHSAWHLWYRDIVSFPSTLTLTLLIFIPERLSSTSFD